MTNAPLKGNPYHHMFTPLSASFPHWTKVTLERLLPYKRTKQAVLSTNQAKLRLKCFVISERLFFVGPKGFDDGDHMWVNFFKTSQNYKRKKKKKNPQFGFKDAIINSFWSQIKTAISRKKRFSLQVERLVSKACCRFEWNGIWRIHVDRLFQLPPTIYMLEPHLHFRSDRTDRNTWKERKGHV